MVGEVRGLWTLPSSVKATVEYGEHVRAAEVGAAQSGVELLIG